MVNNMAHILLWISLVALAIGMFTPIDVTVTVFFLVGIHLLIEVFP